MINLVQAEIYKLVRNKAFWYLMLTSIVLSFLLHILVLIDWWQIGGTPLDDAGLSQLNALNFYRLPLFFNLFVSTLGAFYVSNEFSQDGTIKNQIISGNKRRHIFFSKYLVLTLSSILISVVLPLLTAIISVFLFGHGEIFSPSRISYLCLAFILFTFQFLSFTAIVSLIAILTEDSGKTILFTLVIAILMLAVEKLSSGTFVEFLYQQTVFSQFNVAFKFNISSAEVLHSIVIGGIWGIILLLLNIFTLKHKEIK